jgi:hypothetical protein
MNNLRTRLEAAGKRGAEEQITAYVDMGHFRDPKFAAGLLKEGFTFGHASLEGLVEKLGSALSRTRGQWIHSVNAEGCLEALRELEAYLLKGEGK